MLLTMARAEDNPDDAELLAALRARRPEAFATLVKREQDAVWRSMMRLTQDAAMAEDLSQEAFLRVYQRLDQFRGDSRLSTWVLRVAFNIGLRYLERQRTNGMMLIEPDTLADVEDDSPTVLQQMLDLERQTFLTAALAQMPALPRALLGFYYVEAMPLGEIADSTGLPIGTIKSHLFRARQWLREQSDRHFGVAHVS
ncbi:RNA polymerase subunit sigma-24 [Ahniella affigens]|uniref:RNA polymerase subunit sigma-24 n=1 Tax=Ahniella affigens TaxID=2021234 RepID=A0A2P1PXV2_9GAMM|nr:sigma-70 family RNA polymerase sigma factor [Ahniella affigens]AVP99665.1 RNA polymerase subunit sigma-24 [Ahniella affigens]